VVLYAAHSPAQVVTPIQNPSSISGSAPRIVQASDHNIPRERISRNAVKVLESLLAAGFESYLVGGCVRDLLLDRVPKDFDVATAAEPEQVSELFRNCRLIGRRFRLAHVRFGREIVEVATFRASHASSDTPGDGETNIDGRIVRDNVYGTLEDDAWRRDFTVNSLYYDIRDDTIVDHVNGMADIEARTLRLLGDPDTRYREDPVRMLRAARFAAKLDFSLEDETATQIEELSYFLGEVPPARLFDETLKLFLSGHAEASFDQLQRFYLFEELFPETARYLEVERAERFVRQALVNTDLRIAEGKPVTPGFLFAALLWEPMHRLTSEYRGNGMSEFQAHDVASHDVINTQSQRISFPRRFSLMAKDIWTMQPRLEQRKNRRARGLLESPRFRAAYDFLALRCQAGDSKLKSLVDFWTKAQEGDFSQAESSGDGKKRGGRRRGGGNGNRAPSGNANGNRDVNGNRDIDGNREVNGNTLAGHDSAASGEHRPRRRRRRRRKPAAV